MKPDTVRDLPLIRWKDPDAWMESMKGAKWENMLQEESDIAKKLANHKSVKERLHGYREQFVKHREAQVSSELLFITGKVKIQRISSFFLKWAWIGSDEFREARDIYSDEQGRTWVTKDIGQGSERLALQFYASTFQASPSWTLEPVGDFAVVDNSLYILGVTNKLWFNSLWIYDANTGAKQKCLYMESDPRVNLAIQRKEGGEVIFSREMSQDYTYYKLDKKARTFKKTPSEFSIPKTWKLPKDIETLGISFCWPQRGLLITKFQGSQTLWFCSDKVSPKELLTIPGGSIEPDRWSAFNNTATPLAIHVNHPAEGMKVYVYSNGSLSLLFRPDPQIYHYKASRSHTKSDDGTTVYMCSVYNPSITPTKLLVWGYGAYGVTTGFGSVGSHWAPLLDQGWCISCVFLRGGGDYNEAWGKEGRREGRWKTLADFKAGIKSLQERWSIAPSKTVIYGRSAGGLLVGATLGLNPEGLLMGCVFTEVPYVDVLRTTSNTRLPLTRLEYNEFGNPIERIEDLINISQMSPADLAVGLKTPNVTVIARTAVNDSEVYAYEPIKWIRRLREGAPRGSPKVIFVSGGQGHFTPPDSQKDVYALDCAILDAWGEGEIA